MALEVDAAGRVLGGLPPSPSSPVLSSAPSPASPAPGSAEGMSGGEGMAGAGARIVWGAEAAGDEGPLEMEGEDAETMEVRTPPILDPLPLFSYIV